MKTLKIAFFDTKSHERTFFTKAAAALETEAAADGSDVEALESAAKFEFDFFADHLNAATVGMCAGHDAVCVFANDHVSAAIAAKLGELGVGVLALRSVGYNNVDVKACSEAGLKVVHVDGYSPYATAEFAVALLQSLNRKIHLAYNRTRDSDFRTDGFVGTEIHGKTVGIIGAGKIGKAAAEIFCGYGARVLLNAAHQNPEFGRRTGAEYVNLTEIFKNSDYVLLFCPLVNETRNIINENCISLMKKDAIIVNTGRTSLIDSKALLDALGSGRIKGVAFDIYEEDRQNLYGDDWSPEPIQNEDFRQLLRIPNALVTYHQAYLTEENLAHVARVTLENIRAVAAGSPCGNMVNP